MSVFSAPSFDQHELVAFHSDADSGLQAIVAVHNSNLGPAVGGCRMFPYLSDEAALNDVLRLSRGMTYKSALAGLPLGGGKAVIVGDPHRQKNRKLLLAMGRFIDSLGGRRRLGYQRGGHESHWRADSLCVGSNKPTAFWRRPLTLYRIRCVLRYPRSPALSTRE